MENNNWQEILKRKFADKVTFDGESGLIAYVDRNSIEEVLKFLKEKGLDFLADISSVDYKDYFDVVYQLYSFNCSDVLTIKVKLDHDNPEINSVSTLWSAANWMEREVYDLMGIKFLNHPNLERILTWEGFEGHPLRKDYVSKSGRK